MDDLSLKRLRLVDAAPEAAYDNLVQLAAQLFAAPVALVSIVQFDRQRQFFKSHVGLPEPVALARETPLSHSFCRHVVESDRPLVVEDAKAHPLVSNNPAVDELGVLAYLGAPVRTPDGTPVGSLCVIDTRTRQWTDNDVERVTRLASCVSDAIRLQASANESEALRAEQRAFTYALSHELRSPLTTAMALLHELSGEHGPKLETEDAELLRLGCTTLENAGTLLDNVLRYTRTLESSFTAAPVSLNTLLVNVLDTLNIDIERTGATFRIDELPCVTGDADQLEMLLENLVNNAIVYATPGEPPLVSITARRIGHQVELQVVDNGVGLSAEHHEGVFDLFNRQHPGTSAPGAGIGLTACRHIVANHQGTIQFSSGDGVGARLTVRLPASAMPLAASQAANGAASQAA